MMTKERIRERADLEVVHQYHLALSLDPAYIMPTSRYPVAVEGVHNTIHSKHYAVVFDVLRAVQYGTAFSPAVNTAGNPRGNYITSGIPANAIVQIKTGNGQIINPNSLGDGCSGTQRVRATFQAICQRSRLQVGLRCRRWKFITPSFLLMRIAGGQEDFEMFKPSRRDTSMNR